MHINDVSLDLDYYKILIIENDNYIFKSLKNFLSSSKYLFNRAKTFDNAFNILKKEFFDILILDFSKTDFNLLETLRKSNSDLYIILLIDIETSSISLRDLKKLSIQNYFEKKDNFAKLPFLLETAINSLEQVKMIKTINEELLVSKKQLVKSYLESIETLRYTVEAKDKYTIGHSERVSEYSVLIGKKLGLTANELKTLKIGGLFHDIGKIGISDSILLKSSKLTDEELFEIKKHPIIGKNILSNATIFREILPIVMYHHERYDGKGYPYGLFGKNIPFLARIVCVADAFDAMSSKRAYRNELDLEYVKNEIKINSGTQFDPVIASIFLEIISNETNAILEIKKRH